MMRSNIVKKKRKHSLKEIAMVFFLLTIVFAPIMSYFTDKHFIVVIVNILSLYGLGVNSE